MLKTALSEPCRRRGGGGFTLVELLIVVSVIALLMGIAMPSYRVARENAWNSLCQNNLRHLALACHSDSSGRGGSIPGYSRWVRTVLDRGAGGALRCPRAIPDETEENADDSLSDVYEVQDHCGASWHFRLVEDILRQQGDEFQIETEGDASSEVTIYDSGKTAAFKITFGRPVIITPLTPEAQLRGYHGGSRHWLCKGEGYDMGGGEDGPWANEVIVHLTGRDIFVPEPNEPITVSGRNCSTSYGMNNQVVTSFPRSDQLLLAEYSRSIINVDLNGTCPDRPMNGIARDGEFAARHSDRMNYVTVTGAVRLVDPEVLRPTKDNRIWLP